MFLVNIFGMVMINNPDGLKSAWQSGSLKRAFATVAGAIGGAVTSFVAGVGIGAVESAMGAGLEAAAWIVLGAYAALPAAIVAGALTYAFMRHAGRDASHAPDAQAAREMSPPPRIPPPSPRR
jgi:hypothetical protein